MIIKRAMPPNIHRVQILLIMLIPLLLCHTFARRFACLWVTSNLLSTPVCLVCLKKQGTPGDQANTPKYNFRKKGYPYCEYCLVVISIIQKIAKKVKYKFKKNKFSGNWVILTNLTDSNNLFCKHCFKGRFGTSVPEFSKYSNPIFCFL